MYLCDNKNISVNHKMYRITVYISDENDNNTTDEFLVYFRAKAQAGYAILVVGVPSLEIIRQDMDFPKENVEVCIKYLTKPCYKNKPKFISIKGQLEYCSQIKDEIKEKQLDFYNKMHNYEYIDENNEKYMILNNLRYIDDLIANDYGNIVGDFSINIKNNHIFIPNVKSASIYDGKYKIMNTRGHISMIEFNTVNFSNLQQYVIYVWEIKEFSNFDSKNNTLYNVHIIHNGKEVDLLENVCSIDDGTYLLDMSAFMNFKYKKKANDNIFEYVSYNRGKQKIIKTSNNIYFNDKLWQLANEPVDEKYLH